MNGIDVFVLVLVIVLGLRGLNKGVVREVFGIGGVVLGFYVALTCAGSFSSSLGIADETVAKVVAFLVLFVLVMLLAQIAGWAVSRFLRLLFLGFVDRLLGMVVGILEALLISGIIVFFLSKVEPLKKYVEESRIGPALVEMVSKYGDRYFSKGEEEVEKKMKVIEKFGELKDEGI